jgi:hypothetical protein
MRRATALLAGLALAFGACGEEDAPTADEARTTATEAQESARDAAGDGTADQLQRDTEQLLDDLRDSAERVARGDADAQQDLEQQRRRAEELQERARRELEGQDQEQLQQRLREANDRAAELARRLRDDDAARDTAQSAREELDRLREGIDGQAP